jgi:hypothetical protein
MTEPELVTLLKKMRYDLTDLQGKVSEALRMAAALDLPDPGKHRCGGCGIVFRGAAGLAEHAYVSHGGPLPAHYERIEAAAVDAEEEAA